MPRARSDKDGGRTSGARHYLAPEVDPFSAGSDTERIEDWDTRPEEFVEVVLGFLGYGQAVMFGVSRDGGSVSVAINIGEKQWSRKHARDAGELIGIIHELALFLKEKRAREAAKE
jgi:hypothetical protein